MITKGRHHCCTNTHTHTHTHIHTHEPMHNCKRTIHSIHFIPLTHIACMYWLQPIMGSYEKLPKIHSSPEPAWRWMKILPSWVATCCASTLRVLNSLRCYVLPTNTKHTTRARDSRTVGIQHKEVIRRQRESCPKRATAPNVSANTFIHTWRLSS